MVDRPNLEFERILKQITHIYPLCWKGDRPECFAFTKTLITSIIPFTLNNKLTNKSQMERCQS